MTLFYADVWNGYKTGLSLKNSSFDFFLELEKEKKKKTL